MSTQPHYHHHHHHHSNHRGSNNDRHSNAQQHTVAPSLVSLPPAHIRPVGLRIPAIEKYAYCLCLHVKPTTIFIAIFKLVRSLLFASILLNTEFSMNEQVNDFHPATIDDRNRSTATAVNILTRIITASVSAVGIYAVISGRAAMLMPLYAMLLIDFFFALPAFYNRDLDSTFADGLSDFGRGAGPSTYHPNGASDQYQRYSFVFFSTLVMIVKIYFLCVIWKCYRYLRLIELIMPISRYEAYAHATQRARGVTITGQCPIVRVLGGGANGGEPSDLGSGNSLAPPPYDSIASSMKPPNYEEAMKSSGIIFPISPPTSQQQSHSSHQAAMTTNECNGTLTAIQIENNSPPPQYAPPQLHLAVQHSIASTECNSSQSTSDPVTRAASVDGSPPASGYNETKRVAHGNPEHVEAISDQSLRSIHGTSTETQPINATPQSMDEFNVPDDVKKDC